MPHRRVLSRPTFSGLSISQPSSSTAGAPQGGATTDNVCCANAGSATIVSIIATPSRFIRAPRSVARIEHSEIRDQLTKIAALSRMSLALHPGYKSTLLLRLQLCLVRSNERANFVRHIQQLKPLLLVERHRKAPHAVDRD